MLVDPVFVRCDRRLAKIEVVGPKTGQVYQIQNGGSWIERKDADMLINNQTEVWCHRKRQKVLVPLLSIEQPSQWHLNRFLELQEDQLAI